METVTITLNADQARALANWVNNYAWDKFGETGGIRKAMSAPDRAQYLELFDSINDANEQLNPSKVRVA